MLSRVEVQNNRGDTLSLPLSNTSGGYLVKAIEGLDPVKATLVSTTIAQVDGAKLQTSRRDPRNITMRLGIVPNHTTSTVQGLREYLYRFLLPQASVDLKFYFDEVLEAVTSAVVETFETSLFSADPEINVSLVCYDPNFYAPFPVELSGLTVTTTDMEEMTYFGMADAGFILHVDITADVPGVTLQIARPDNIVQTLNVEADLLAGDEVVVNTIPGFKGASRIRAGISSSLLYAVDAIPEWASWASGVNLYRVNSTVAGMPYTISHTVKLSGL